MILEVTSANGKPLSYHSASTFIDGEKRSLNSVFYSGTNLVDADTENDSSMALLESYIMGKTNKKLIMIVKTTVYLYYLLYEVV